MKFSSNYLTTLSCALIAASTSFLASVQALNDCGAGLQLIGLSELKGFFPDFAACASAAYEQGGVYVQYGISDGSCSSGQSYTSAVLDENYQQGTFDEVSTYLAVPTHLRVTLGTCQMYPSIRMRRFPPRMYHT